VVRPPPSSVITYATLVALNENSPLFLPSAMVSPWMRMSREPSWHLAMALLNQYKSPASGCHESLRRTTRSPFQNDGMAGPPFASAR